MVFIIYKKTEKNQFALERPLHTHISSLLADLAQINNLRVYLDRLIWSIQQLANKGILKPPQLQGVSWEDFEKHQKQFEHLSEEAKMFGRRPIPQPPFRYVPDKHNQRYGLILSKQGQEILLSAVNKAKTALIFKSQETSKQQLVGSVQVLREAVMQAYPGYIELPQWQPSLLMLEEKVELSILQTESFQIFDDRASVWWAGKQLEKDKTLAQYVGKNEKTKVIVKVQKWGGQQPLRQPPIDSETYQKMVKFYYRKVEQAKEMDKKSVEIHYETVPSKDMKAQFYMPEDIRYKPF